jgi:hypothetical protein
MQVTGVDVGLPGDRRNSAIPIDDYDLACPDPMVAVGAHIATHLNARHQAELSVLGAALLQVPAARVAGAQIGPIDGEAFELSVLDTSGAHVFDVPLTESVSDPARLPEALHDVITLVRRGGPET